MKLKLFFLLTTIIVCYCSISISETPGLKYNENDFFTLDISTKLQGKTRDYYGYTESERDIRTYKVLSVLENEIVMEMRRDWTYSSSDGDRNSSKGEIYSFSFNPNTGAYLNGTFDAPNYYIERGYYTFDYIWF